jgi:hypothetical protein
LNPDIKRWHDKLHEGLKIIGVGNMPPHGYRMIFEVWREMQDYIEEQEEKR